MSSKPSQQIPSVLFAIPFPQPAGDLVKKKAPAFVLYTFPRSAYEKPVKDQLTGKAPKEKIVKKLERKWQHEVKEGQDIKKGIIKDAGMWKKFKGTMISTAAAVIQWMPLNVLEALARLPPVKKLGKLSVFYPHPTDIPPWFNLPELNASKIERSFFELLATAKAKTKKRIILSGCLLPFTLAFDILVIVPVFVFEINLTYFFMQVTGAKKANKFVAAQKESPSKSTEKREAAGSMSEFQPGEPTQFGRTVEHLYSICSSIDPIKFPVMHQLPQPNYVADKDIVTGLIQLFNESVPPQVAARHVLDQDLVAADLDRVLRKAVKEYFRTLR